MIPPALIERRLRINGPPQLKQDEVGLTMEGIGACCEAIHTLAIEGGLHIISRGLPHRGRLSQGANGSVAASSIAIERLARVIFRFCRGKI